MLNTFTTLLTAAMLAIILWAIASSTNKKTHQDYMKSSPFECGFNPRSSARTPFSLQFFLVAIIFIIFDVELIILFPFILNPADLWSTATLTTFMAFILFLTAGLAVEWNNSSLDWAP